MAGTKTYFVSDLHLGADTTIHSRERERMFINWLDSVRSDMSTLYLVGDVFDYWYEYKSVVPKGYIRLLGKLSELSDAGIELHFLKGNHDMWVYDYFQEELGMIIHDETYTVDMDGYTFLIAHGDQVGPQKRSYRWTRAFLRNSMMQHLFSILPSSLGLYLMRTFSQHSRDEEKESLLRPIYTKKLIDYLDSSDLHFDYLIYGHLHDPRLEKLQHHGGTYCNLGDWISHYTYAVWDGEKLELCKVPLS